MGGSSFWVSIKRAFHIRGIKVGKGYKRKSSLKLLCGFLFFFLTKPFFWLFLSLAHPPPFPRPLHFSQVCQHSKILDWNRYFNIWVGSCNLTAVGLCSSGELRGLERTMMETGSGRACQQHAQTDTWTDTPTHGHTDTQIGGHRHTDT